MTKRYLGNIITQNPTAPADNFETTSAPGVWSLAEAFAYTKAGLWPTAGNSNPIGLFGGGEGAAKYDTIQKITILTTGNAVDFGDLSSARANMGNGAGSSTRAIWFGGQASPAAGGNVNSIEFVLFAAGGSVTDFGDLTAVSGFGTALSSSTRAITSIAETTGGRVNTLEYVTMASAGNAIDFGDLLMAMIATNASFSSSTRGIWAGGWPTTSTGQNVIQYVTIASTGNALDFGDLTFVGLYQGGASNSTRGLVAGGYNSGFTKQNIVEYVTIASTGNATDFGDLSSADAVPPSCVADPTRMVARHSGTTTMDYFTIATTGNATDFGDATEQASNSGACSNSHGGLAA